MGDKELMVTLVPLTDEESRSVDLTQTVALFKDNSSGVINVGRPSLAAYYPAMSNMFGYGRAHEKGYYLVVREETELLDKPIYQVDISGERTILTVRLLNEDMDLDLDDVLGRKLKESRSMK